MIRLHKKTEENSPKVPAYIVTFSDMVTLLLTFFVMLLSLAQVQDPALFNKGRDSFVDSIRYIGLGMLFGRKDAPDLGMVKLKYYTPEPDESFAHRSIDANREKARRLFQRLTQLMAAIPSQIVAEKTNFVLANIHFPSGQAVLNESARKYLTEFCLGLQQQRDSDTIKLYVLGLCDDESTEQQQWILSAKRANVVANYLKDKFSSFSNWPVYSWGAGPGGQWRGSNSLISKDSHILIAVLRNGE